MRRNSRLLSLATALALAPTAWAGVIFESQPTLWRAPDTPVANGQARWPSDYGVAGGHCNATAVGNLVGGPWASAGLVGYGRSVATLAGSIPGYALGNRLGPGMDAVDRGCMGHSLELAPSFHRVRWVNPNSQAIYELTPMRRLSVHGRECREFSGQVFAAGAPLALRGTACRTSHGVWRIV